MKAHLALIAALVSLVTVAADAAIVNNSSSFDVAYGYTGTWNATETAATNTPITAANGVPFTIGDFTVTVSAASGGLFLTQSVTFVNRNLAGSLSGTTGYNNVFTVTATYNGPAGPVGTIPGSEQVTLAIDSISIYGFVYAPFSAGTILSWEETTPGHAAPGPDVTVQNTTVGTIPANYTNVQWLTAADLTTPGATGTTITRTFQIPPGAAGVVGDQSYNPFDGFIVQGSATFSYDIPEPASLGLLTLAAPALVRRRRVG